MNVIQDGLDTALDHLHDHQYKAVQEVLSYISERKHTVLAAPTGSGKTEMAIALAKVILLQGQRTLFVTERLTLLSQAHGRFDKYGMQVGLLGGGEDTYRASDDVHVATIQTLRNRIDDSQRMFPTKTLDYGLIIIDEVHIWHSGYDKLIASGCPVLGLSATPHNERLGYHFDEMVTCSSVADLIRMGFLAPARIFQPEAQIDTRGVARSVGDFASAAMGRKAKVINGDVIANWKQWGEDRPTIVFACNIQHSKELCEQFNADGVPAAHLDHKTDPDDQATILGQFEAGDVRVLCSVIKLTAGFDAPWVSCVILARPTASESLHIQMLGRGLRTCSAKTDCLVFDHAGNIERHGRPQDYLPPTLEDCGNRAAPKYKRDDSGEWAAKFCDGCHAEVSSHYEACDNCGHKRERRSDVITVDVSLTEHATTPDFEQERLDAIKFYQESRGLCDEKGWKIGKAKFSTQERFPDVMVTWSWEGLHDALPPSEETRRWHSNKAKQYWLLKKKGYQTGAGA